MTATVSATVSAIADDTGPRRADRGADRGADSAVERGVDGPAARYASVEELLAEARAGLDRLDPRSAALEILSAGARLVDIRPSAQRAAEGEIPGALIIERNHLEWRLHPASDARVAAAGPGQRWIVVCSEGYTSSLAAAALVSLGVPATDIEGGFVAWARLGLPTVAGPTPVGEFVPAPLD